MTCRLRIFAWNFTRSPQCVQSTVLPASTSRKTARLVRSGCFARVRDRFGVVVAIRNHRPLSLRPEQFLERASMGGTPQADGLSHERAHLVLVSSRRDDPSDLTLDLLGRSIVERG